MQIKFAERSTFLQDRGVPPRGARPKPVGQSITRHKLAHDFTEFVDIPYTDGPRLPARGSGLTWPERTRKWWRTVSSMPHCAGWSQSDWEFAFEGALLAAAFHTGDIRAEGPLRRRETIMGMTADSRASLRIRYVSANPEADEEEALAGLVDFESFREALIAGSGLMS